MSKYGDFSGPYFPAFGLNTDRYGENADQKKLQPNVLSYQINYTETILFYLIPVMTKTFYQILLLGNGLNKVCSAKVMSQNYASKKNNVIIKAKFIKKIITIF